jgi:hypothetical protein
MRNSACRFAQGKPTTCGRKSKRQLVRVWGHARRTPKRAHERHGVAPSERSQDHDGDVILNMGVDVLHGSGNRPAGLLLVRAATSRGSGLAELCDQAAERVHQRHLATRGVAWPIAACVHPPQGLGMVRSVWGDVAKREPVRRREPFVQHEPSQRLVVDVNHAVPGRPGVWATVFRPRAGVHFTSRQEQQATRCRAVDRAPAPEFRGSRVNRPDGHRFVRVTWVNVRVDGRLVELNAGQPFGPPESRMIAAPFRRGDH